ncbi:hypothetical protein DF188_08525 [Aliarcobacter skirrowii]|uniref:Phage tail collar domain-containing protein n=1 Tax=Aliarcobacter skirrowii TaxID=28200 RepID=A0A2U2BZ72_9BACT|nr:tail fiber protein [Aliarcobacter skirrowii]PWE20209.1 hypothetical protein DF188_08525 [Aliarcobacter skirrowii]
MGINFLLPIIAGIVMTIMVGAQVAPSIVEGVKVKKTQVQTINNQEVIFEAIKRYTTIKQVAPTSIQDLIDAGYLKTNVNDNGFGKGYTINVDKALGVATITTTIEDPRVQEIFLNSFTSMSKPICTGTIVDGVCDTNDFKTTFVIPNEVMHGNALLMTGIPIQATPPDSNINKYWYDTSSGKATLKLYDGTKWVKVNLGGSVSVGSIETFAGIAAKIPEGYLLCNGQEVSRTTYKDLFDVIGTTYGFTSGTTFKVPDLRGKFVRGNGSTTFNSGGYGNVTHSSAGLGVVQGDAIRNLYGHVSGMGTTAFDFSNGVLDISFSKNGVIGTGASGGYYDDIIFNASRVVPTANENRPINMSMNYIIKH